MKDESVAALIECFNPNIHMFILSPASFILSSHPVYPCNFLSSLSAGGDFQRGFD